MKNQMTKITPLDIDYLELKELSSSLVKLWHEAIGGEVDLPLGLEQFILRL